MGQKKLAHEREVAKILFMQGLTQAEIAEKLGVSKNSVNKWAKDGHWETVQKNLIVSKSERLSELYEELAELSGVIKAREEGLRFPTPKRRIPAEKLLRIFRIWKQSTTLRRQLLLPAILQCLQRKLTWNLPNAPLICSICLLTTKFRNRNGKKRHKQGNGYGLSGGMGGVP
jgi:transcriptional regulator with XRE-family HTH domain